jgi:hypothetical protein
MEVVQRREAKGRKTSWRRWAPVLIGVGLMLGVPVAASAASGDFNGDGFADLAIGIPGEDIGGVHDAGAVQILYGTSGGLKTTRNQLWHQESTGILDTAEAGDHFGSVLFVGDFNGDRIGDLAIGIPDEDIGAKVDAGAVAVLYGARTSGLSANRNQFWHQDVNGIADVAEAGDRFGEVLTGGRLDSGARIDLVIPVARESIGTAAEAGAVHVLYGTTSGLSTYRAQYFTQNSTNIEGDPAAGDRFGAAVLAADITSDGRGELVIGVPGEDLGRTVDAGAVHILIGSGGGVTTVNSLYWTQDTPGIPGVAQAGDNFGAAFASGQFNRETYGDEYPDFVLGVPGDMVGTADDAGAFHVFYGTVNGISLTGNRYFTQDTPGIADVAEPGDRFGERLFVADFDGDNRDDLLLPVPGEDVGGAVDAGAIHAILGSSTGLNASRSQFYSQAGTAIADDPENDDRFSETVAIGDFNGDGRDDVAVSIPGEDVGGGANAGAVQVLYGSSTGVSLSNTLSLTQNTSGIADAMEPGDRFGAALTAGDYNGDSRADLVIGVPGESFTGRAGAGAVHVVPGYIFGLSPSASQFWTQDSPDIADVMEPGDAFGATLQ